MVSAADEEERRSWRFYLVSSILSPGWSSSFPALLHLDITELTGYRNSLLTAT